MVFYDTLEFGGLEEYATTLAVGLKQRGHQTSVLSAAWVPPDNQYRHRLRQHEVPLVQLPKWLSYPASDWPTKEKILASSLLVLTPLVYLLGVGLFLRPFLGLAVAFRFRIAHFIPSADSIFSSRLSNTAFF